MLSDHFIHLNATVDCVPQTHNEIKPKLQV